jgi:hypothetical protein
MRSLPTVPTVPPTPAPTHHLQGLMLMVPLPDAVTMLFSSRYFRMEVVPAVEITVVLM